MFAFEIVWALSQYCRPRIDDEDADDRDADIGSAASELNDPSQDAAPVDAV